MTLEEVLVKVGVDTSQVEPKLLQMKMAVQNAGGAAHSSFVHASNGAREFKKVIHEIMQTSPALGLALKAAISPIGAALMGGAFVFGKLHETFKEFNKEADRIGKENAKPFYDVEAVLMKIEDQLRARKRAFEEWFQTLGKGENEHIRALKQQVDLLHQQEAALEKVIAQQIRLGRLGPGAAASLSWRARMGLVRQEGEETWATFRAVERERATAIDVAKTVDRLSNNPGRAAAMAHAEAWLAKLRDEKPAERMAVPGEKAAPWLKAALGYIAGGTFGAAGGVAAAAGEAGMLQAETGASLRAQIKQTTDALQRMKREQDAYDAASKKSKDRAQELDKQYQDLIKSMRDIDEKYQKVAKEQPVGGGSPYVNDQFIPGSERVINSRRFVGYHWGDGRPMYKRSPFAGAMEEYERMGEVMEDARVWGEAGRYNAAARRRDQVGSFLRSRGLLPQESDTKQSLEVLKQLLDLAKPQGQGLTIQPKNGE